MIISNLVKQLLFLFFILIKLSFDKATKVVTQFKYSVHFSFEQKKNQTILSCLIQLYKLDYKNWPSTKLQQNLYNIKLN